MCIVSYKTQLSIPHKSRKKLIRTNTGIDEDTGVWDKVIPNGICGRQLAKCDRRQHTHCWLKQSQVSMRLIILHLFSLNSLVISGSYESLPCPPGTYSNATGAINNFDCFDCDPGFYCSNARTPGKYRTFYQMHMLVPCTLALSIGAGKGLFQWSRWFATTNVVNVN